MVFEFKFPDVGEGITEGVVVSWLVKEGEVINENSPLVKVETDKAVVDIPSPKTGKILIEHFREGETVKVGQVIATISERFESLSSSVLIKSKDSTASSSTEAASKAVSVVGRLEEAAEEDVKPQSGKILDKPVQVAKKDVLALPAVRALAKELGLDLSAVTPTGPQGSITIDDVKKFSSSVDSSDLKSESKPGSKDTGPAQSGVKVVKKYDMYGYVDRVPIQGVRKAIMKKMVDSFTHAVHVTHMDEVDVTRLVEIREHEKDELRQRGIKLTYMPFIVKSVVGALKEHPSLNATVDEANNEIILKKYYNIGIAVDTAEGLVVPVVKIADKKSLIDLASEIEKLARSAADRSINMGDLKGGSFTITNVGSLGGFFATPIINYPEVAILATGKIYDKAMLKNGHMQFRKVMPLSLTFDHRVIDGAEAARFTNKMKQYLEDPDLFLFER
jgi:pyruvate dehydrogenase E2 component (dihydrolipoamide acetyltransferase)